MLTFMKNNYTPPQKKIMRRVALFYIFALTEDSWILIFASASRILQYHTRVYTHERMRVKKANKSLYQYENSFDLIDSLKNSQRSLWVLGLYFENS